MLYSEFNRTYATTFLDGNEVNMMNINKLKGKVIERGMTMEMLASEIGINRSTLYRKMANNGDSLTIKEVNKICGVLELEKDEAMAIFFTSYVA